MKKTALFLLLIFFDSAAMLSQVEMGQAHSARERPLLDTCCDCASDPKLYASIALESKACEFLVDKTWGLLEQHNQTVALPLVYASAVALNIAAMTATGWYCFRLSKLKDKED